ncbi:MAG TPA: hypothetical protein VMY88_03950 [Acidimicrobiales bacterium]|nr:hypothetical protein [Acidimicrobiales bacterium]
MPRLEIELTSERPDGTWTWRAAGAKQPKGVVQGQVVPGGAKVGDVLRAEAEIELDGINVTSLAAPKEAARSGPEVLKLVGSQAPIEGVTTSLVGRRGRDRDDRPPRGPGDRPRGPRSDGPRGPRQEGDRGPRQGQRRDGAPRDHTTGGGPDTRNRPPRADSDARSRPRRPDSEGRSPGTPGQARPERDHRRPPRSEGAGRDSAARGAGPKPSGAERKPVRPRPPKFQPGRTHRDAALAALPEEQRPIAEQILKGGVRAVREALAAQKIDPGPMVTLAENLAPALRAAEWRDRAEEAVKDLVAVPLRELRAIVTAAADAARGEGAREIATNLKDALTSRTEAQKTEWAEGVAAALEANRPLRALRQASRPPGPSARLTAELASRLAQAASSAMTSTTPPARWLDLLEAVVASPVSRTVRPEGIPESADDELKAKARAAAGSVPALAPLLGMKVPPPPVRRPGPAPSQPQHRRPHQPRPHRPAAEPAPIEPAVIEPAAADPAPIEPAAADPAPIEPALIEPARDEPAEPSVAETTAPLNPVIEAEQEPMTEPGSDPEQLDSLGVRSDHVDDPVLVQELEQPGDDGQLGDLS